MRNPPRPSLLYEKFIFPLSLFPLLTGGEADDEDCECVLLELLAGTSPLEDSCFESGASEIAPNLFLRGVGVISIVLAFNGFFGVRNSELGCFDGDFGLEGGAVDKALALFGDLGGDLGNDLGGDLGGLEVEGVTAGEF